MEQAERVGLAIERIDRARFDGDERFLLHRGFDVAAFAIEPVELGGERRGGRLGIGEEAANAERHVGQAPRGVEPGTGDEAQVVARRPARIAARDREQRLDAGLSAAGADAREPLRDERPVDPVEAHDVGHGAQRDEVEQPAEIRLRAVREVAAMHATSARVASST